MDQINYAEYITNTITIILAIARTYNGNWWCVNNA